MSHMQPHETITVETNELYCDGGSGSLGHPRVFLIMSKNGSVDCPYCGRHFVLATAAETHGNHP